MKSVNSKIMLVMLLFTSTNSFAKKDKPSTIIKQEITINVSIEEAWQVLGHDFANAQVWASSIKHSKANNSESFNGSSCSERGCDVSGFGEVREKVLEYSNEDHILSYEVIEGKPKMISLMTNYWKLTETADGKVKLEMKMEMKTKGIMGAMMKGMMKKKMKKMSGEVVEEFKYYVENGTPHPRKIKATK